MFRGYGLFRRWAAPAMAADIQTLIGSWSARLNRSQVARGRFSSTLNVTPCRARRPRPRSSPRRDCRAPRRRNQPMASRTCSSSSPGVLPAIRRCRSDRARSHRAASAASRCRRRSRPGARAARRAPPAGRDDPTDQSAPGQVDLWRGPSPEAARGGSRSARRLLVQPRAGLARATPQPGCCWRRNGRRWAYFPERRAVSSGGRVFRNSTRRRRS